MASYTEKKEEKIIEISESKLNGLKKELEGIKQKYSIALEFLEAMSFTPDREGRTFCRFVSKRATICDCQKAYPAIIKSLYGPGKWLAQCPECYCRTEEAENPIQAVKMWNARKYTEESIKLKKKLEPQDISTDGMIEMFDAVTDRSIEDLKFCTIHGELDSTEAKESRDWIRNKRVIDSIESGDWIKPEEEPEEEESCGGSAYAV